LHGGCGRRVWLCAIRINIHKEMPAHCRHSANLLHGMSDDSSPHERWQRTFCQRGAHDPQAQ